MLGGQTLMGASTHSRESSEMLRDVTNTNSNTPSEEKKGLFGKWKAKLNDRSEQKKLEKERAKSPPAPGHGQSRTSLSSTVVGSGQSGSRGRSMEILRGSQSSNEGGVGPTETERGPNQPPLQTVVERPVTEARERADMSGLSQTQPPPMPTAHTQVTEKAAGVPTTEAIDPVAATEPAPVSATGPAAASETVGQSPQAAQEKVTPTTNNTG